MLNKRSEFTSRCRHINKRLLKLLTGKKNRQIKIQRLHKVQIWAFGLLVQQINSL